MTKDQPQINIRYFVDSIGLSVQCVILVDMNILINRDRLRIMLGLLGRVLGRFEVILSLRVGRIGWIA